MVSPRYPKGDATQGLLRYVRRHAAPSVRASHPSKHHIAEPHCDLIHVSVLRSGRLCERLALCPPSSKRPHTRSIGLWHTSSAMDRAAALVIYPLVYRVAVIGAERYLWPWVPSYSWQRPKKFRRLPSKGTSLARDFRSKCGVWCFLCTFRMHHRSQTSAKGGMSNKAFNDYLKPGPAQCITPQDLKLYCGQIKADSTDKQSGYPLAGAPPRVTDRDLNCGFFSEKQTQRYQQKWVQPVIVGVALIAEVLERVLIMNSTST